MRIRRVTVPIIGALFLAASPAGAKPDVIVDSAVDSLIRPLNCDGVCTLRTAVDQVNAGIAKSIGCDPDVFPPGDGTEIALVDTLIVTASKGFTFDCKGLTVIVADEDFRIESAVDTALSGVSVRGVAFEKDLTICGGSGTGAGCDQPVSKVKIENVRAENVWIDGGSVGQVAVTKSSLGSLRVFAHDGDVSSISAIGNHLADDLAIDSDTAAARKLKLSGNTVMGRIIVDSSTGADGVAISDNKVSGGGISVEGPSLAKISVVKNLVNTTTMDIGIMLFAAASITKAKIEGNVLTGPGDTTQEGLWIASNGNISKVKIAKNRISGRGSEGIESYAMGTTNGVQITGNLCLGNDSSGMELDYTGSKNRVQGNTLVGNAAFGIDLAGAGFDVSKNRVLDNGEYGIDGTEVTGSSFKQNTVRGHSIADLYDQNGCPGSTWKGNIFETRDPDCIQ